MLITLPDGSNKDLEQGATVADVAASIGSGLAKAALAGKINGQLVDVTATVSEGDVVEIITNRSPEALGIMRHSAAHIMAEAVRIVSFLQRSIKFSQSFAMKFARVLVCCARENLL